MLYFGLYFGMIGEELRKEFKARGCKVGGNKVDLILRFELSDVEINECEFKSVVV